MTDHEPRLPEGLEQTRDRHSSLRLSLRWIGLAILLTFVIAALLNVFGQRPTVSSASSARANLRVDAPERLRGGIYFQATFNAHALRQIRRPTLVLDRGWLEAMTMNSIEPTPRSETISDGRLRLLFDPLKQGDTLAVWTQWQVNPTNHGSSSQDVALLDGGSLLTKVNRTVTVFP